MSILENVTELINYGIEKSLIDKNDKYYIFNRYIKILEIHNIDESIEEMEEKLLRQGKVRELKEILKDILDYAVKKA